MLPFSRQSEIFNQILLLKDNSPQTAREYIKSFTCDYRLGECRAILWGMVETCLTCDNSDFGEPGERLDLLLQFEHFQKLFEAAFVLANHWNNATEITETLDKLKTIL
ncbi:MAG: hypothetical protein BGO55_01420 [Sphingobacteriales bacterium 50-39]|nr:MAG: hypothetical protein BGO55_01420 [Sphingobacteriales bacterium 50-39]